MNEKAREAAAEALRRWFHGTPAAPYTMRGHNANAAECGHCDEAADVASAAVGPIIAAKAWDEGMRTGTSRAMRHMSDEPHLPLASAEDNPYLAQEARP